MKRTPVCVYRIVPKVFTRARYRSRFTQNGLSMVTITSRAGHASPHILLVETAFILRSLGPNLGRSWNNGRGRCAARAGQESWINQVNQFAQGKTDRKHCPRSAQTQIICPAATHSPQNQSSSASIIILSSSSLIPMQLRELQVNLLELLLQFIQKSVPGASRMTL